MSGIKTQLTHDMKTAMREKDKARLSTLRLILAAIKQREVDERIELEDVQILEVLDKMRKQRVDAIEQFQAAGRLDLVEKEQVEIACIQDYLPAALSANELQALIAATLVETEASGMKDMAKVMAALKPSIQGRADGKVVSQLVKQALAGS